MIVLSLLIAVAFLLFYIIVFQLNIPGVWKFGLVVVEMLALNQVLIKRYGLPSEMGLVLLKSKKGIKIIEGLARSDKAFNFMADVGSTISYGLLSLRLMRKNTSWQSLIFGTIILVLLARFIAPVALSFLLSIVGIGGMSTSANAISDLSGGIDIGIALIGGLLLCGGLFLLMLFGVVFYGIVIFKALVMSLFFGSNDIIQISPGGHVLLPGVNLPLFEGILALAIVMAVHEGAHAVLARIAKVPILSSGVVLFGIIPIGAFVEPDEKKLAKSEAALQTRVLVAGPTANMLVACAFFVIFMIFFLTTPELREGALYIVKSSFTNHTSSPLPEGTLVYRINGTPVDSIDFNTFRLPPNEGIVLETNRGNISRSTNAEGKLGIEGIRMGNDTMFSRYSNPILQFFYVILGLSVALNFVVGSVNILPIPLFDGYRVLDVNVRNKIIVKAVSYTTLFFFIMNFVPRFFH